MTASPSRTNAGSAVPAVFVSTSRQPGVDGAGQHARERLLALRAAGVALEEEPLERTQLRPADIGPHRGHRVGRLGGGVRKDRHLATLDLVDDGEQQLVTGPEVVQQHSVTGADGFGDLAKRPIADAAVGEGLDEGVEQLPAPLDVRRSSHAIARCAP